MAKSTYPTAEQIAAWKAEHGCFEFEIDEYKCWFRRPSLKVMKAAFISMAKSEIAGKETLISNCWLAGDEQLRKEDDYFLALADSIFEIFEAADYEIKKDGIACIIGVNGKSCKVRKPTRDDVRKAEEKNKRNQPFDTNIFLLDAIWVSGDDEIRTDEQYYIPALSAINEIKTQKVASIKKY